MSLKLNQININTKLITKLITNHYIKSYHDFQEMFGMR